MTNIIKETINKIDNKATVEKLNNDVIVISSKIECIMVALIGIGEDCWAVSNTSLMINRRAEIA